MPQGSGSSQETPRETPQEFFNRNGYRQGSVFDRLGPREEVVMPLWQLPKVPVENAGGNAEGKKPMSAREERIRQGENRRGDDDDEEGGLCEPELDGELVAFLEGKGGAGRRRGREDDGGPSEEAGEAEAEPPAKVPRSPPYGGGGGDGLGDMSLD